MHYFSDKFSKNHQALGAFRPQYRLTLNIDDRNFWSSDYQYLRLSLKYWWPKVRDLAK